MFKNNLFSNLIALLALCISLIALAFTLDDKGEAIIFGSSKQSHYVIDDAKQVYVLSIPLEFHNSSKSAVSLKHFKADEFISFDKDIHFKLYLSNVHLGSVPKLWIKQLQKEKTFDPSLPINHIIRANQSYKINVVVLIEDFDHIKKVQGQLNLTALFSNAQTVHIQQQFDIGEVHE